MKKTLFINCSFKGTISKALLKTVRKFSLCTIIPFNAVGEGYKIGAEIDAIVISGSSARIVNPDDRIRFEGVIELIKACNLPIFGICFGHQLLCLTLGAKVGALPQSMNNCFQKIRVVQIGDIFAGFREGQTIPLAEYHSDYVLKESLDEAGLILLADSPACEVEAVKHNSKPFFGVQFHPERITIRKETYSEGHRIIENFYKNVVR